MQLKTILIFFIITCKNGNTLETQCYTDFHFDEAFSNGVLADKYREIYEKSWNRSCSNNLKSVCSKNLTISYFEMRPYTNDTEFPKNEWQKMGVIQKLLSVALAQCCGNCMTLTFNKVTDHSMLINTRTKEDSDITFPVFIQGTPKSLNASLPPITIPLIRLPAAMFITKSIISAKLFAKEVVVAIIDIWPLLGVSLLLAFAAGVLMWIIDTWQNKQQFPRRFLPGSFEGFWWAFISMTTVGYGDRTPLSIQGRLFAVFWILCGITVTSLMTAALTTAISAVTERQKASIYQGRIGILHNHIFEKTIVMRGNAESVYKNNIIELVHSIENKEISGMLVDTYTAKSLQESFLIDDGLYLDSIIQDTDQSYISIDIYDRDVYYLLHRYFEFQHSNIQDFVFQALGQRTHDINNKRILANLIFTTGSGLFWPTVYTSLVVLGFALLIGGIHECYQIKRKYTEKRYKVQECKKQDFKKEEDMLHMELNELLQKWDMRLSELTKMYYIQGVFSKTKGNNAVMMIKLQPSKAALSILEMNGLKHTQQIQSSQNKSQNKGNNNNYGEDR